MGNSGQKKRVDLVFNEMERNGHEFVALTKEVQIAALHSILFCANYTIALRFSASEVKSLSSNVLRNDILVVSYIYIVPTTTFSVPGLRLLYLKFDLS